VDKNIITQQEKPAGNKRLAPFFLPQAQHKKTAPSVSRYVL
jgi:hypothetical protein